MAIAPIRTPMVDAAGKLTPEWQRYFAGTQSAATATPGSTLADPFEPTSVALTVAEYGENYRITPTWTAPSPLGTTSKYEVQFKFYTEASCTIPEGDWGGTNEVTGGASTSLTTDPWPKADAVRYVRCRVRGLNADNAYTAWVESVTGSGEYISAASGGSAASPPTQPTLSDWSLGSVTISADANKNYYVGITLNFDTTLPGDSELIEFWFYRGSGSGVPADPGLWQWCGSLTAAGSTTFYDPHPGAATTWKVCATSSRGDYRVWPSLSTPTRDVAIASVGLAGAISGAGATLQTQTNDGVKQFRYEFAFTAPASTDQNYRLTVIESAWVDVTTGDWVPGVSKWERVLDVLCYGATVAYLGNDPRWTDCIRPGVTAGRRRWRIRSVNWNDEPSLASQPADITNSILTDVEPYTDGFNASAIKPSSLAPGMKVSAAGELMNVPGDSFGYNLDLILAKSGWTALNAFIFVWSANGGWPSGGATDAPCLTTSEAAQLGNDYLFPVTPGEQLKMEGWMYTSGANAGSGTGLRIYYYGADGATFVGNTDLWDYALNLAWTYKKAVMTVPTGAKWGKVVLAADGTTSGVRKVSGIRVSRLEPVDSSMLERAAGTASLQFVNGSLGLLSKYPNDKRPVLSGGAPNNADGNPDGSYWINTTTGRIFKKISGVYKGLDAEDVVAGTFIGTKLLLSLNGVDTTIDNTLDLISGQYAGLRVKPTPGGNFTVVGTGIIFIGNTGGAYPTVQLTAVGGLSFVTGFGVPPTVFSKDGVQIGATSVLRAQQTSPGSSPGQATDALASNIGITSPGATYGATEQSILEACRGRIYYLNPAVRNLQSKYNSLETVFAALLVKLRTHGMIA